MNFLNSKKIVDDSVISCLFRVYRKKRKKMTIDTWKGGAMQAQYSIRKRKKKTILDFISFRYGEKGPKTVDVSLVQCIRV
jgi:hypothetical protein